MAIGECSVYSKLQAVGGLKGQVCSLAYELAATSRLGALRVSTKVVDHPVMNFVWKVEQSHLVEQGPVADRFKCLAEIQSVELCTV